jgi:hypothetical protein
MQCEKFRWVGFLVSTCVLMSVPWAFASSDRQVRAGHFCEVAIAGLEKIHLHPNDLIQVNYGLEEAMRVPARSWPNAEWGVSIDHRGSLQEVAKLRDQKTGELVGLYRAAQPGEGESSIHIYKYLPGMHSQGNGEEVFSETQKVEVGSNAVLLGQSSTESHSIFRMHDIVISSLDLENDEPIEIHVGDRLALYFVPPRGAPIGNIQVNLDLFQPLSILNHSIKSPMGTDARLTLLEAVAPGDTQVNQEGLIRNKGDTIQLWKLGRKFRILPRQ